MLQAPSAAEAHHVLAVNRDATLVHVGKPKNRVQHSGLAGTVGAHEAQRLPATQGQINAMQDFAAPVSGMEPVDAQSQRARARQ